MERRKIEALLQRGRDLSVLVLGDVIVDEYVWGNVSRISPEAPVQVVEVIREEIRPGGAGNVAMNLLPFGCRVTLCGVTGKDQEGELLRRSLLGVDCSALLAEGDRRTSRKTRVVASNQQMVRIDRESRDDISTAAEERLIDFIRREIARFDLLLISDYRKGVLTPRVLAAAIAAGVDRGIPVVVDPKGSDFALYRGATIVTPNRGELEIATGSKLADEVSLAAAASAMLTDLGLQALLVTRSEQGMSLFRPGDLHDRIPAAAREVFDVTGAGDTVVALLGLGLALGLDDADAARMANHGAGVVVGKVGTSTVTPAELLAAMGSGRTDCDDKIREREVLRGIMREARSRGRKVVFTNGCFDLLHAGHVRYLQKARALGDILVLGLNSDLSVRRLKGDTRPLIAEAERAHLLAALSCVDYVCIFDEDTPLELIRAVEPDLLVKGGDYTPETVVGREFVESRGGSVVLIDLVEGWSTTGIVDRIRSSHG